MRGERFTKWATIVLANVYILAVILFCNVRIIYIYQFNQTHICYLNLLQYYQLDKIYSTVALAHVIYRVFAETIHFFNMLHDNV